MTCDEVLAEHKTAQDWFNMWTIAANRANEANANLKLLSERIAALPEYRHHCGCQLYDYSNYAAKCTCGVNTANAARAAARKAAELED